MSHRFKLLAIEDLESLYAPPNPPVVQAHRRHLTDFHISYLEKATFFCLATNGKAGLDCSPRGGDRGFVHVIDSKTVAFADWPGNNKIASLRNIVESGRAGMLFIFPGLDIFMRINGEAGVSVDGELLDRLSEGDRRPKTAILITIDSVFYHCGKALNRAGLWKEESRIDRRSVPSPGLMMKELARIEDVAPEDLDQVYDHAMKHELYSESE